MSQFDLLAGIIHTDVGKGSGPITGRNRCDMRQPNGKNTRKRRKSSLLKLGRKGSGKNEVGARGIGTAMHEIDDNEKAKKPVLSVIGKRGGSEAVEGDGRREREQVRRDCALPL